MLCMLRNEIVVSSLGEYRLYHVFVYRDNQHSEGVIVA